MTGPRGIAALLAGVLALAGCAGGIQTNPRAIDILDAASGTFSQIGQGRSGPPPLTREILDGLDGSFMEVSVENTGAVGYLFVAAERNDEFPGRVRVWRSEDNATFALRQGVLIQTRGMGNDVLSTAVAISSGGLGPARGGQRLMSIAALDNKALQFAGSCDVRNLGSTRITIIGRSYPVRHVQELCEFDTGRILNEYWIGSADVVWQSRQWAGPGIGYLTFRRLTR
jgi:hypothetical protein